MKLLYIYKGLKFSMFCLLIVIISQYISIFFSIIFIIILCIVYNYLLQINIDKETINDNKLQEFSNSLTNKYNINKVNIKTTKSYSGILSYRILRTNILEIPQDVKSQKESKAVIAHEIGHIVNKDVQKYSFIYVILLLISSITLYLIYPIFKFTIIFIFLLIFIVPSILNYINHKFEYKADKFAVKHTSRNIVSIRLRRNNHLLERSNNYFPYIVTHPSTEKRLQNISKD